MIGLDLSRELAEISEDIGRQIGLLINRQGQIEQVVIGDTRGLLLPEMGRHRGALTRFSGLRLVHTHISGEGLSQDDLNDLAALRLDMAIVLITRGDQHPPAIEAAQPLTFG